MAVLWKIVIYDTVLSFSLALSKTNLDIAVGRIVRDSIVPRSNSF